VLTPFQWTFESAPSDQVYIKNSSGTYLGVDEDVDQGAPIICSKQKLAWEVKADEKDATKFLYLLLIIDTTQDLL
jgi:hypothetical protein